MTAVGLALTAAASAGALARRRWLPILLSCGIALPSTAAVVVARNAVGPFAVAAVVATLIIVGAHLHRAPGPPAGPRPGRTALLAFTAWAVLVTAVGPVVFAGIPVLNPRRGVDAEVQFPSALGFTISHVAQAAFLVTGVGAVAYLARQPRSLAALPTVGFALGTLLSNGQLIANRLGLRWPVALFSNSPNVRYINFTSAGEPRFRGVFAEPSVLATFSITALAYFVCVAGVHSGRRRITHLLLAGGCLVNLVVSYAGTALVGGALVATAAVAVGLTRFVTGRARWHQWAVAGGVVVLLVVTVTGPVLWSAAARLVAEKLASDSFATRSASSVFSLGVFADTWGVGAGLGSNRPSSFPFMLVSCVGVVGTVLFVVAVAQLVGGAWRRPGYRPAAWALIAFFLAKAVAGANMSDPVMWLLLGVCAHGAWTRPPADPADRRAGASPRSDTAVSDTAFRTHPLARTTG